MAAYIHISSSTLNDLNFKISQLLNTPWLLLRDILGREEKGKSDITLKTAVYENVKFGLQNMPKVESI